MVLEDLIAANAHALFLCPQQSLAPSLCFIRKHGASWYTWRHLDDCLSDERTTEENYTVEIR